MKDVVEGSAQVNDLLNNNIALVICMSNMYLTPAHQCSTLSLGNNCLYNN